MRIADGLARGERISLRHVCHVCVDVANVAGVGLSMLSGDHCELVCAVGDRSEQLAELQATLGEGPSVDTLDSAGPELASELSSDASQRRWPVFAPAAIDMGMGAVFAFPLQIGMIRLGVLTLYRAHPVPLGEIELADAFACVDVALVLMLDAVAGVDTDAVIRKIGGYQGGDAMELHQIEVHQAVGVIAAQLDVGVDEALVRLRAYAFARDQRLGEVARAVVARRIRLEKDQKGV